MLSYSSDWESMWEYDAGIAEENRSNLTHFSCGWGSGALYFAEMLPNSNIVAFSNSRTQKQYIENEANRRKLENVRVITGDVVEYEFERGSFDRVVSIEVSGTSPSYECWLEF